VPGARYFVGGLPDRFVQIRYYGLLANRHREKTLALCRGEEAEAGALVFAILAADFDDGDLGGTAGVVPEEGHGGALPDQASFIRPPPLSPKPFLSPCLADRF